MRRTSSGTEQRLAVEALEDRMLLAATPTGAAAGGGTINIKHVGEILRLNGDAANNCAVITSRQDELRVTGCDGTTIKGAIDPTKVVTDIIITMFEGNDSLTVKDVRFAARVFIHMNEGKDSVQFDSVEMERAVFVGLGKAKDVITAEKSTAIKAITLDGALDKDKYTDEGRNTFERLTCVRVEKGCKV